MAQDYTPKTVIGNYNKTKHEGLNNDIDTIKLILDHYKVDTLTLFTSLDAQYIKSLKNGLLPIESISLRTYNELMAVYLTLECDIKKKGEDKNTVTGHKPMTMMEATLKGKKDDDEPTSINERVDRTRELYDEAVKEAQKKLFKTDMMLKDMQTADLKRFICFNHWDDEIDTDMWHSRDRLLLFLYGKLQEETNKIFLKKKGINTGTTKQKEEPSVIDFVDFSDLKSVLKKLGLIIEC
jgi:hypothetical protein